MKCIKTEDAVGHVLCHDMTPEGYEPDRRINNLRMEN